MSRRGVRNRTLILAYHNVLPAGAPAGGDSALHLPVASFSAQLDLLAECCEVIPLSGIHWKGLNGGRAEAERPRVAITFDDAYQGAITVGVAELRRRSMPATIFVAPAFLGGKSFWWDVVGEAGASRLSQRVRRQALIQCRGEDTCVREWAAKIGLMIARPTPPAVAATLEELEHAMGYERLTLGSHTWSHPNLPLLSPERLDEELTRPSAWLAERFSRVIKWISYPYGSSSAEVEAAAQRAGYEGGLLVQGGWVAEGGPASRLAIPRLNVSAGLSVDGFALRLAGMLCD